MSTKEVDNKLCEYCESEYRLTYSLDKSSGFPKFCPFCGSENCEDEKLDYELDEEKDE